MFRVNLKACLGLVLPNQYCLTVARGWFWGDVFIFVGHPQTVVVSTIQHYRTV